MIKSIYESQKDILEAIKTLYCPDGFECDLTYGNGGFWKTIEKPKYCFDITPLQEGVVRASSACIPLECDFLNNLVFDPPFMTYVKNGRDHKEGKVALTARFGGYYTYLELEDHYRNTLYDACRVLKKNGIMVFKCQDIIHNHQMHCTHAKVIAMAESMKFRLKDLFVLCAKHRMPGPQKGTQRHARIFHSYFLVFENKKYYDV